MMIEVGRGILRRDDLPKGCQGTPMCVLPGAAGVRRGSRKLPVSLGAEMQHYFPQLPRYLVDKAVDSRD
jgi:hypothetical protein